jgi:hypothetical protein
MRDIFGHEIEAGAEKRPGGLRNLLRSPAEKAAEKAAEIAAEIESEIEELEEELEVVLADEADAEESATPGSQVIEVPSDSVSQP